MIELKTVVVEQQAFTGNLLISYDTMREEDITIIPAQEWVKISYKFLPFVNTRSQDFVASVSHHRSTEVNTVPSVNTVNNVAERYLNHSSPVPNEKHIPTNHHEEPKSPPTNKQNKHHALAEALKTVSGSVTVDAVAGPVDLQGKG